MANRHPLVVKLKSGEYDGADIMQAWLLIEDLQAEVDRLTQCLQTANKNHEHFEREWYLRGDEIERWRKYAEHLPDCGCLDRMDSGRLFPRHDWPCSCGLRELQTTKDSPQQTDEKGRPMTYWGGLDPDYPEYANISAFIDDVLKAAGVTEVVDMDGHTAAELLVMSLRRQLEKDTP